MLLAILQALRVGGGKETRRALKEMKTSVSCVPTSRFPENGLPYFKDPLRGIATCGKKAQQHLIS